jgi:hypothetical protein
MTAGEPDGSLRAHVMARIAAGDGGRGRRVWLAMTAAASAAALALAVFVARNGWLNLQPRSTGTQEALARPADRALSALPAGPALPARPADLARPAGAPSPRRRPARPALQDRPAGPSEVAALAPPPLGVASISLAAIAAAESIELPELETIVPITLAPIGEPQGERR